jgi:transcription antitermination factor NusG
MPWHVCKVVGRESRACFYLSRAGVRSFHPVEHRYFLDKRTKQQKFRVASVFPGYVFVELHGHDDRDAACRAIGVTGLLGWWADSGYRLATIPTQYVTDLMDAKPREINKPHSRSFNKGQKVELALNALSKIVGEFKGELDGTDKAVITVNTLGSSYDVTVKFDRLLAAE